MKKFFAISLCLVCLMVLAVGCSKNQKLGGKVTFSDDNTALDTGTVIFESATLLARGTIEKDGTYTVGTESDKDGIPPGEYKVYISGAVRMVPPAEGSLMPGQEPLIEAKFTSGQTSGLIYKADGTNKKFDIKVDRP